VLSGIHVSASGGTVRALERAERLSLETAQIFTSNQTQWRSRRIDRAEWEEFRSRRRIPVISHGSYLVNLASDREEVRARSAETLRVELERMNLLGIESLVIHPGSHMGHGEEEGIRLIAEGISGALESVPGSSRILLENTAGMGTSIGWRFEHLAALLKLIGYPERTGVCIDTAHAFAAGYDLRTPDVVESVLAELDDAVGLGNVGAFHINDSKTALGSRVDRHAHVGEGMIGLRGLRHLAAHEALTTVPAIVETPGTDEERKHDLDILFTES
jgi:deoxyribonuclease-4